MRLFQIGATCAALVVLPLTAWAQEEEQPASEQQPKELKQVLTQEGYDRTSPAIVKIVSDAGRRIGTGVLIAVHQDDIGFVLTSYSMVAGRDKVAVILKDHSDALLGHVVEQWIDFDLDLAVIGVRDFPRDQTMITIADDRKLEGGKVVTAIAHAEDGDWQPIPTGVNAVDSRGFAFQLSERTGVEGAPILNEEGYLIGMTVSDEATSISEFPSDFAVRSSMIKPLLKEWFEGVELKQRWKEKSAGIAAWMWIVGGGVVGGGAVTAAALAGGGGGGTSLLPRPPDPPQIGQ